ncbi:hypothetical protein [uncultured Jatrophihabitans sp.]|uniref:hypothetical protein n=1 Tax=uncultured Jatrophihabitans sp. TaxID=1610747 RepID=UPI0035CB576A
MRLMIHTIQVGDELTMIGPDGRRSERFTLADMPLLKPDTVWLYREFDAPIIVGRTYGLDASFELHSRRVIRPHGGSRVLP